MIKGKWQAKLWKIFLLWAVPLTWDMLRYGIPQQSNLSDVCLRSFYLPKPFLTELFCCHPYQLYYSWYTFYTYPCFLYTTLIFYNVSAL